MRIYSACLLGIKCRYNGEHRFNEEVFRDFLAHQDTALVVCPEMLAGFPSPREPVFFSGGDGEDFLEGKARIVVARGDRAGEDVSGRFREVVEVVDFFLSRSPREMFSSDSSLPFSGRKVNFPPAEKVAFLKDKSPSCGVSHVYVDGELKPGCGFFAALLKRKGFVLHGF